MRRRDFLLAIALLAHSLPGAAQQLPLHARVGWLAHEDTMPRHFFDEALARLGWVEGKNLIIERRFGGTAGEQITSAAGELIAWHPDVIVALGTIDARPVLALTRAIPIVVVTSADPVGQCLGASLARPGGSVTGIAAPTGELVPKLLELARDLIPKGDRVSLLYNAEAGGNVEPAAAVGEVLGLNAARWRPTISALRTTTTIRTSASLDICGVGAAHLARCARRARQLDRAVRAPDPGRRGICDA